MRSCAGCGGLIMEPNLAYGYAGKVCQCAISASNFTFYKQPERPPSIWPDEPSPKLVPQDDPV